MFSRFYPDEYVDNVYKVPFENLRKAGYQAVIFDIDNTLTKHGEPPTEENVVFFENLHQMGWSVFFLSNNKEPRVKSYRDKVHYGDYIYLAGKPNPKNYIKAMEKMHSDIHNTIFVGDQLFTDVWGAKRAGIRTFLSKPINPHEEIQIVLKRILEKPILACYRRSLRRKEKK